MGLFNKKKTSQDPESIDAEAKEELSPYQQHKKDILESYKNYPDDQLFTVTVFFENGQQYNIDKQLKSSVAWLLAHKLINSGGILEYSSECNDNRLDLSIDLNKIQMITVKPEVERVEEAA